MAAHSSVSFSSFAEDVRPPSACFTPSLWTDTFASFSLNDQVQENYAKEIEILKEEVRSMLTAKAITNIDKLVLVDTLERLGVAYHFDKEIEEQLEQIYNLDQSDDDEDDQDSDKLFATALQFRLLRQHQYPVSSNVFDKFKDTCNKFKETICTDAKGLLSLYEATQVRTHSDNILDEAVEFTRSHLNRMVMQLESPLRDQVKRALQHSLHRSIPRVETFHYISTYELDAAKNDMLLKLAKLDFNFLQNLYKKELCEVLRWWNELDLKSKLPYTRDRMVESYLWGMACHFEPQYSYARMVMTINVQVMTTLDDTYDNYATIEEAQLFTEIMQRWDVNEIDSLPEYMKIFYKFVISLYEDYEREAAKHGKEFAIPYATEAVKQLCRAYYTEMKWFLGRQKPTFDEYLSRVLVPISGLYLFLPPLFAGLPSVSKETMDWLVTEPNKMLHAAGKIGRYLNDLGSHEREKKDADMFTVVDCYMKQHGVSKKEVTDKFLEFVETEWKNLNAEWLEKSSLIPKEFLVVFLNYARSAEITYRNSEDGFTSPESSFAPLIQALFVDPMII